MQKSHACTGPYTERERERDICRERMHEKRRSLKSKEKAAKHSNFGRQGKSIIGLQRHV
jgi:hypothetical protein